MAEFKINLQITIDEFKQGNFTSFKNLSSFINSNKSNISEKYTNWLIDLNKDFDLRFNDFRSLNVLFRFGKSPENASLKDFEEICNIFRLDFEKVKGEFAKYKAALMLSEDPDRKILCTYEMLSLCYSKVLSMFADSYECESCFSKMNYVLNEYRSNLAQNHVEDCLMTACSEVDLDFDSIVTKIDCQISH